MKLDWQSINRPVVALSPMADMTDSAFCRTVKSIASTLMFREMISSEALVRGSEKTMDMAFLHEDERPIIQQIFGADPEVMGQAAAMVEEEFHPEGIDINMGCPVYKLTSNFNGSALMKDAELATKIVKSMKASISVPLSVKMRAGWSDHEECIEFAKVIEDAGADAITVHGRTKVQAYAGKSNRDVVRRVKEAVSIPVMYNGDIFEYQDCFDALKETGCDGVLIARRGLGNPWIFKQIEQVIAGEEPMVVTMEERVRVMVMHLKLHVEQYGEGGVRTFRKHISWYLKGLPNMKETKVRLMAAMTEAEVVEILHELVA